MLSEDTFQSKVWRLERVGGDVIAPHLTMHSPDRLGGFRSAHLWRWSVRAEVLVFSDWHGRIGTVFNRISADPSGRIILEGKSRYDKTSVQRLTEIEPVSRLATHNPGLQLFGQRKKVMRRNLVILRANENSLHPRWAANMPSTDRSWDLCVSYYGAEKHFPPRDFAEFHVLQRDDRKFSALYKILHVGSRLWDYDFFMFPDDDLMMSWMDINNLFEICREHRLELAQPALTSDSFYGPEITVQRPNTLLRYVNFVEVMTPIFSLDALRICAPSFRMAFTGWGLDRIWPTLLGSHASRVAIIDLIGVRHTRPIGDNYGDYDAGAEGRELARRYGVNFEEKTFGRLDLI